ncbi:DUF308 domain-containing protein [Mycetocola zhujimingii]|uniref:DUF308 domain-containing protein n=1 Tax=Mycetocola zhujimingii TaxID=2079792 RepID=UPI0013C42E6F|nr:DUF308 domain-containing protein [Mycetocola zhujimingii]
MTNLPPSSDGPADSGPPSPYRAADSVPTDPTAPVRSAVPEDPAGYRPYAGGSSNQPAQQPVYPSSPQLPPYPQTFQPQQPQFNQAPQQQQPHNQAHYSYPQQQPNPYGPAQPAAYTSNGPGLTSFIIGIAAMLIAILPGMTFGATLPGVIGIVFGIIGLVLPGRPRRQALWGLVLSGTSIILGIILAFVYAFGSVLTFNGSPF